MYDIVAVGELLIDFTPMKESPVKAFAENPGGAPCNMLTMAQKLGSRTAFIGQVGKDQFGLRLGRVLEEQGIETKGLVYSESYPTTLAFVHLNEAGDRSFSFYRKGCADVMLQTEDVDFDLVDNARAFHFGSLSFTDDPGKTTILRMLERVKANGTLISYDPNYRPLLWPSEQEAIEGMKLGLTFADVVKVSDEEAVLLTGHEDVVEAAQALLAYGIQLVCVTLGGKGSYFAHKDGAGFVRGFEANVVDTTGAGDSFFGAVMHQIVQKQQALDGLSTHELKEILEMGNCAASLCIEKLGGIPAIPSSNEVLERFKTV